ncbi:ras guanine nucleotide exchange factor G [Drosophila yakuba]|uniref:DUF4794 domain-containing protein n=1 Tax=Drosophila yakuba TaxID=7245 RepID=B4Q2C8_DROYA|nr:ras guanine nucleotide exchange factor G [Drosophila yakuba]EDX01589.2 uncharacterized protein Dyak_GE16154 [Drosophila yakuba]
MSSNRIRPELVLLQLLLLLAATLIPLLQAGIVTAPHFDSDSVSDLDSVSDSDPDTTTIATTNDYDPHAEMQQQHLESETEATAAQVDGQRIDCKLTFDAATMDSLGCHNEGALTAREGAWLATDSGNKPMEELPEANPDAWRPRHLKSPDSQPIYELQLVVWPSDIEDGDDFSPPLATTTSTTTTTARTTRGTSSSTSSTTSTTTTKPNQIGTPIEQVWPLYEDQLVVFPQMDFEEENLDYFFDEVPPTPTPTTTTTTTTTTTLRPTSSSHPTGTPTPTPIYVVENYHVVHPNGTEEYKLVMSNGLVNYKKLYTKRVADRLINVQEGYNAVPIPGPRNQIQTQYYIADERGYNVYRIELHYQQPGLPKHLHYKATKATNM